MPSAATEICSLTLPALLSDHAVLQRSPETRIWGWAPPGEAVSVRMADKAATALADAEGRWQCTLDLSDVGAGPWDLTVRGRGELWIRDVIVGDVWLCSGQSNMEWQLGWTADGDAWAADDIARSSDTGLRHFLVPKQSSLDPRERGEGRWELASPATVAAFTAVGYYFGREVRSRTKAAVGLVHASWGGTAIERWISRDSFQRDPALHASAAKYHALWRAFQSGYRDWRARYEAWEQRTGRIDPGSAETARFAGVGANTEDWKRVHLPGALAAAGLPDGGVIWLRRTITVPSEMAGVSSLLSAGVLRDFDSVYWNGVQFGETTPRAEGSHGNRLYWVPGEWIAAGEAVVAIRLFCPGGGGAVEADPALFRFGTIALAGDWLAKAECVLESAGVEADYPRQPYMPDLYAETAPSDLFNAMIRPLVKASLRGVLWYQGESNAGRAGQYRTAFPMMIQDWRAQWGQASLPFYFCQLAGYGEPPVRPGESAWAELREAQSLALAEPDTGMAVLIELGESRDVHPRNKREVGRRLALLALAGADKEEIEHAGPTYASHAILADRVRVKFRHVATGLVARPLPPHYAPKSNAAVTEPLPRRAPGGALEGFAVCGADRVWHWAAAVIEGDNVVVSAPAVPRPIAVRYAWADFPVSNLENSAGLPAAPFRTDDFPLTTAGYRY